MKNGTFLAVFWPLFFRMTLKSLYQVQSIAASCGGSFHSSSNGCAHGTSFFDCIFFHCKCQEPTVQEMNTFFSLSMKVIIHEKIGACCRILRTTCHHFCKEGSILYQANMGTFLGNNNMVDMHKTTHNKGAFPGLESPQPKCCSFAV